MIEGWVAVRGGWTGDKGYNGGNKQDLPVGLRVEARGEGEGADVMVKLHSSQ